MTTPETIDRIIADERAFADRLRAATRWTDEINVEATRCDLARYAAMRDASPEDRDRLAAAMAALCDEETALMHRDTLTRAADDVEECRASAERMGRIAVRAVPYREGRP